jgi:hypothetical protein
LGWADSLTDELLTIGFASEGFSSFVDPFAVVIVAVLRDDRGESGGDAAVECCWF